MSEDSAERLYLRKIWEEDRNQPCCICGRNLDEEGILYGIYLYRTDDPGCDLICLPCACRYWYDQVEPIGSEERDVMLSYCLRADFFGDGMQIQCLPPGFAQRTPEACSQRAQEVLDKLACGERTCVVSDSPVGSCWGFAVLRLGGEHDWIAWGWHHELLHSLILTVRWTNYLIPKRGKKAGPAPEEIEARCTGKSDAGYRYEFFVRTGSGDTIARIVYYGYGGDPALKYALSGVVLAIKERWGIEPRVLGPSFANVVHPIKENELADEIQRMMM